jgi:hypothetical protein
MLAMPDITFDYAVIRVVPRVEREEFVNVGVVLSCPDRQFLEARIEPDWHRMQALAPGVDRRLVEDYLGVIPRICKGGDDAGPIGRLAQRERFHWLVAPRSTIIQMSPVHSGVCGEPHEALNRVFDRMVAT